MPHFRAQMNCVPGMVTQFSFTPIYTTAEYREMPFMVEKVANMAQQTEVNEKESKWPVQKSKPSTT